MRKANNKKPDIKEILIIAIIGVVVTALCFLLDSSIASLFKGLPYNFISAFFVIITMIGNIEFFIPLVIIISIIFILKKKKFIAFWLAIIFGAGLDYLLKDIIMRPRPFEILGYTSLISTTSSSFPSGHSMMIFVLLPFLLLYWPKYKIYFWIIAVLVAFSRIYLGVHYLSDVVAGAFIGYIISSIAIIIGEKYGWR